MEQSLPYLLQIAVRISICALGTWCVACLLAYLCRSAMPSALRELPVSSACAFLAFALALLPTIAKRTGTTGVSPVAWTAAGTAAPHMESRHLGGDVRSGASAFWLSQIDPSSNSVALGVAWLPGAFAAPPFIEFFVNTNLAVEAWTLLGWAEAEAGETNLCVDVEASRLPGGTMPPAAFFRATAYDGLGADCEDDDGDGIPNGWESSHGTNPLRADTDGDGISDGEEASWASIGEPFPDLDLSSLANILAGTQPYAKFPPSVSVALPFAVEMAGHFSTSAVVHVNGIVAFPEAGGPSSLPAFSQYAQPSNLYATTQGAVAAYGISFLSMGYTGSQLRAGVVQGTQGRWFVAEWSGMQDPMGFANLTFGSATFRLAVSEADPGTFRVQYVDVESMDATQALLGAHGFGGEPSFSLSGSIPNGTTVAYRFGSGTSPTNPDSDGDGLPDGWEAAHGMDPLAANTGDPRTDASADPDLDGLTNAQEAALGTDPFQPDTDGDGMDDGWESRHGFDPTTHNDDTARTDDDASADPDGDGLTNTEECAWGTNPSGDDANGDGIPDGRDTDRDGVVDGAEIAQGSDPADATDEGKPNSRTPVSFYFGDHSTSCSEKYRLTVSPVPVTGETDPPRTFSWVNARYDQCETRTAMLMPGYSYEVRLTHASTKRPQGPDYDYTLNIVDVPQTVIVSDPDSLLGVHSSSDTFTGVGLVVTLTAYKVDVAVCSPDDPGWAELDVSRVVLDDEELRIKVTVTPQMASLAACRQKFGDSITIKTSGTCSQGATASLDNAVFSNVGGKSEIRMSRSFSQLKQLGLLPSQDDDGIDEMAWVDMGDADPSQPSNLTDSEAFATLGYQFRGKATCDTSNTLESTPPNASPSESFFKAAGCEVVSLAYGCSASEKRQIMNQCDVFYYSGHGHHDSNDLTGGFTPDMAQGRWNKDLRVVVISGCSVLDINDYNCHYEGSAHTASPGRAWEAVGPPVFLGYNYSAPGDAGGAPARIVQAWIANRSSMGNANAWMKANADNRAWNACAIIKGNSYLYFKKGFWGQYRTVMVNKENW